MKEFEEILEEVRTYDRTNHETTNLADGLVKNPDVQAIDTGYDRISLWNETDIRNDIGKALALAAVTGVCAYFSLMAAPLYIPLSIGCLCYTCYKYGVYRGRNED